MSSLQKRWSKKTVSAKAEYPYEARETNEISFPAIAKTKLGEESIKSLFQGHPVEVHRYSAGHLRIHHQVLTALLSEGQEHVLELPTPNPERVEFTWTANS